MLTHSLSLVLEEPLHNLAAVVLKHSGSYFCLWMQHERGEGPVAPFDVGRSIDDTRYLRPSEGTGTHRTWLYRYIKCAVGEILAAELVRRHRYGLHLSVGGNIVECFRHVVRTGYNPSAADDNGSDGYFALFVGSLSLFQCPPHVVFILLLLLFCAHSRCVLMCVNCCSVIEDYKTAESMCLPSMPYGYRNGASRCPNHPLNLSHPLRHSFQLSSVSRKLSFFCFSKMSLSCFVVHLSSITAFSSRSHLRLRELRFAEPTVHIRPSTIMILVWWKPGLYIHTLHPYFMSLWAL